MSYPPDRTFRSRPRARTLDEYRADQDRVREQELRERATKALDALMPDDGIGWTYYVGPRPHFPGHVVATATVRDGMENLTQTQVSTDLRGRRMDSQEVVAELGELLADAIDKRRDAMMRVVADYLRTIRFRDLPPLV